MSYEVYVQVEHGNKHAEELDTLRHGGKFTDPDYDSERSKIRIVARCLRDMADRLEMEAVDAGEMKVVPRDGGKFNVYTPEGPKYGLDMATVAYLSLQHGWEIVHTPSPSPNPFAATNPTNKGEQS